mmetsp:Transcript_30741/g.35051  ORF Transcript_30741/g.35051 Transcript_30741/m.35051 type:complete len:116 (+) Transcript_30741:44-391(+)
MTFNNQTKENGHEGNEKLTIDKISMYGSSTSTKSNSYPESLLAHQGDDYKEELHSDPLRNGGLKKKDEQSITSLRLINLSNSNKSSSRRIVDIQNDSTRVIIGEDSVSDYQKLKF